MVRGTPIIIDHNSLLLFPPTVKWHNTQRSYVIQSSIRNYNSSRREGAMNVFYSVALLPEDNFNKRDRRDASHFASRDLMGDFFPPLSCRAGGVPKVIRDLCPPWSVVQAARIADFLWPSSVVLLFGSENQCLKGMGHAHLSTFNCYRFGNNWYQ